MTFMIVFFLSLLLGGSFFLLNRHSKSEELLDYNRDPNIKNDQFLAQEEIRAFKERKEEGLTDTILGLFLSLFGFFGLSAISLHYIDFVNSLVGILVLEAFFFLCMYLGGRLAIRGRQQIEPSAEIIIKYSTISPILYLRSFSEDRNLTYSIDPITKVGKIQETSETLLIYALKKIGPVIAIGKPGEKLPLPGASRSYFTDEEWFSKIKEYISEAKFIFVSISWTEGLSKEIHEIIASNNLKKTIFYLVLKETSITKKLNSADELKSQIMASHMLWSMFLSKFNLKTNLRLEAQLNENIIYKFLYFDKEENPCFYQLKYADSNPLSLGELHSLTKDVHILLDIRLVPE